MLRLLGSNVRSCDAPNDQNVNDMILGDIEYNSLCVNVIYMVLGGIFVTTIDAWNKQKPNGRHHSFHAVLKNWWDEKKRFVVQLLLSFDEFPNSSPLTLTRCCNNELLLAYMGFELNHISPYQCIIAIVTISMSINRRSLYGTIRTPWALYRVFLIRCTNSRPLSSSEWLLTVAVSAAIRLITYPD